ncbi:MAG: DUF5916 domain-containing protein [Gemmatimonadaceae bacterium]
MRLSNSRAPFRALVLLVAAPLVGSLAPLGAQQAVGASPDSTRSGRKASGRGGTSDRREVRAMPAGGPIRVDGVLDESVWKSPRPATDFVQSEPFTGQPATEKTEVWIAFDNDNLYVAAYMHDRDPQNLIVNDIKKDFKEEDQDTFELLLDTFGDRRNGYVFSTNPEGARHDRQVALEGREVNQSWDAVWDVKTRRAGDGWTAEIRIPFRALRFDASADPVWGVNFSRRMRHRNEVDFWSPVPRSYNLNRVSLAGDLTGLRTGSAGRDLRIKPYIAEHTVRPLGTTAVPSPGYRSAVDVGVDLRAAITSGLTLDATIHPDFGQAEADEQQVNLTQFSLFLPEKRDFFLENSGIFYVGDAARNNRVNPTPTPDEDNLLFFSRRVGLNAAGEPTSIDGGLRLTGKFSESMRVGLMSVQERGTSTSPAVNSTVFRLRQNLGRVGNDLGLFIMQRTHTNGPEYQNRVYGVDKNLRLPGNFDWNSYVVRTETPGITKGDYAWRSTINHDGNFFHVKTGAMQLGPGFRNELGYYRRVDNRKYLLETGIRPRSPWLREHGIRELHPHIGWDYQEGLDGRINSKNLHSGNSWFFNNGAVFEISANPMYNRLERPFKPNPKMAAPIPAGGYGWSTWQLYGTSDQSRLLSSDVRVIWGGLYTGTQRTVNGSVTVRPSYRFKATFGVQRTEAELDLPQAKFTNSLYTLRANYSFTTNMFLNALSQFDPTTKAFNANVRFNLIHHPLSDLFIVYNDQRILTPDSPIPGRAIIMKFTQMIAF